MLICSSTCDVEPSGDLSRPECLRSGADHDSAEIPGRGGGRPEFRTGPRNPTLNIQKNDFKKVGRDFFVFVFREWLGMGARGGGVSRQLKDHRLSPPYDSGGCSDRALNRFL